MRIFHSLFGMATINWRATEFWARIQWPVGKKEKHPSSFLHHQGFFPRWSEENCFAKSHDLGSWNELCKCLNFKIPFTFGSCTLGVQGLGWKGSKCTGREKAFVGHLSIGGRLLQLPCTTSMSTKAVSQPPVWPYLYGVIHVHWTHGTRKTTLPKSPLTFFRF